jgi:hypothetical protein
MSVLQCCILSLLPALCESKYENVCTTFFPSSNKDTLGLASTFFLSYLSFLLIRDLNIAIKLPVPSFVVLDSHWPSLGTFDCFGLQTRIFQNPQSLSTCRRRHTLIAVALVFCKIYQNQIRSLHLLFSTMQVLLRAEPLQQTLINSRLSGNHRVQPHPQI